MFLLCAWLGGRGEYRRSWQEAPYRTTVMEPLGKMNAIFPVVNEHINKRNHKVRNPSSSLLAMTYSHGSHRCCSSSTTTLRGAR